MRKLTKNEVVQVNGGLVVSGTTIHTAPYIAKTVGLVGACVGAIWIMPIALLMAGFSGDSPDANEAMILSTFLGFEFAGSLLGAAVGYGIGALADYMVG